MPESRPIVNDRRPRLPSRLSPALVRSNMEAGAAGAAGGVATDVLRLAAPADLDDALAAAPEAPLVVLLLRHCA